MSLKVPIFWKVKNPHWPETDQPLAVIWPLDRNSNIFWSTFRSTSGFGSLCGSNLPPPSNARANKQWVPRFVRMPLSKQGDKTKQLSKIVGPNIARLAPHLSTSPANHLPNGKMSDEKYLRTPKLHLLTFLWRKLHIPCGRTQRASVLSNFLIKRRCQMPTTRFTFSSHNGQN